MTGNDVKRIRGTYTQFQLAILLGCTERSILRWESYGRKQVRMYQVFEDKLRTIDRSKRRKR